MGEIFIGLLVLTPWLVFQWLNGLSIHPHEETIYGWREHVAFLFLDKVILSPNHSFLFIKNPLILNYHRSWILPPSLFAIGLYSELLLWKVKKHSRFELGFCDINLSVRKTWWSLPLTVLTGLYFEKLIYLIILTCSFSLSISAQRNIITVFEAVKKRMKNGPKLFFIMRTTGGNCVKKRLKKLI